MKSIINKLISIFKTFFIFQPVKQQWSTVYYFWGKILFCYALPVMYKCKFEKGKEVLNYYKTGHGFNGGKKKCKGVFLRKLIRDTPFNYLRMIRIPFPMLTIIICYSIASFKFNCHIFFLKLPPVFKPLAAHSVPLVSVYVNYKNQEPPLWTKAVFSVSFGSFGESRSSKDFWRKA